MIVNERERLGGGVPKQSENMKESGRLCTCVRVCLSLCV